AVLLGAWSAGLDVAFSAGPGDVGFATPDRAGELTQPERYLVGLHPFGLPLRDVPAGYLDYTVEVRGYGDRFGTPPGGDKGGDELAARAEDRAAALGLTGTDRILIDTGKHPDPVDWLLAPVVAGASTVLCGHLDPAKLPSRVDAERVTRTLPG